MAKGKGGYLGRLWAALLGRAPAVYEASGDEAEMRSRIAGLEMDVRERDERIEKMKVEYAALQAERDRAAGDAGDERLAQLFKKLAGPLSNMAALAVSDEEGKEPLVADFAQLAHSLEKHLARAGLEPIGRAGEHSEFDVALHQRMSGGDVRAGAPVVVRLPGYRFKRRVLVKAMVSAREG